MRQFKRDMFLIPREAADKIYQRFGYAALGEFTRLVDMYQRHWDAHGSGEGFDMCDYSDTVLVYFDLIQAKIDEKNREYFAKCEALAENAVKAVEARTRAAQRREAKRQWYAANSAACNEKRRQKYAAGGAKTGCTVRDKKANEHYPVEKEGAEKRNPCADTVGEMRQLDRPVDKSVDNCENEQQKNAAAKKVWLSSESTLAQGGQGIARKQPNRIQDYGYYGHKVIRNLNHNLGGGQVVDKSVRRNPTGSLSGHNRLKSGGRKDIGLGTLPQTRKPSARNAPQPPGRQLPAGERGLGKGSVCAAPPRLSCWFDDSVVIGDDFEVDLTDAAFRKFARADKFLRRGFENWCAKTFLGEKHDKDWLARIFEKFAVRQGKVGKLLE